MCQCHSVFGYFWCARQPSFGTNESACMQEWVLGSDAGQVFWSALIIYYEVLLDSKYIKSLLNMLPTQWTQLVFVRESFHSST